MSISLAPRVAPLARSTPSLRAARTEAEDRQIAKARWRHRMAALAAEATSIAEARQLVRSVIAAEAAAEGRIGGPVDLPSNRTLGRLRDRWLAGERQVEDYRDAEREGRPRIWYEATVAAAIEQHVQTPTEPSIRQLALTLREEAADTGVVLPSRATIGRRLSGLRLERTAARFGRRLAELEALAHGTLDVALVHEVWELDEVTLPVWACQWDDVAECYVPVRLDAVLVQDYRSRVILCLHLCDPSRRRGADGRRLTGGFDREDVLAALFSAAIPELASPPCAPFAGYLPRVLRWDNAAQHRSLVEGTDEDGHRLDFAPLTEVLTVPKLPAGRPINRGLVERTVSTMKSLCFGLPSHIDRVIPAERVRDIPAATRTLAAAAGGREPRRELVPADALPTIDELRKLLEERVRRYNDRNPHAGLGNVTPATAYRDYRNRDARSGRDLISVLPSRTSVVTSRGIVIQRDHVRHEFAAATEDVRFKADRDVTYRPDPLFRGLFAVVGGRHEFMPRLADEARRTDKTAFAKQQRSAARVASEVAATAADEATTAAMVKLLRDRALAQIEAHLEAGTLEPMHGGVTPAPPPARPAPSPEERLAQDAASAPAPRRPLPGAGGFAPRLDHLDEHRRPDDA